MVERRNCSFCGSEIEPGTGSLYIRKDAVMYNFCSNKCRKNQIAMGRIPRRTRWTKAFIDLKAVGKSKAARARPEEGEEVEVEPDTEAIMAVPKTVKKSPSVQAIPGKAAGAQTAPSKTVAKPTAEAAANEKPKVPAKKLKAESKK
jgi:large subunit ribosomal protein L24e